MRLIAHTPPRRPTDEQLQGIVDEINKYYPILMQGLLRDSELKLLTYNALTYYENAADRNSIQYRKYDKARRSRPIWKNEARSSYVEPSDGVELLELKQQIEELLDLHQFEPQTTELFLPAHTEYTARHYLRNILSSATTSIEIEDEHLFSGSELSQNIDILWIVQPYMNTSLNLEVKLLGKHQNPPKWVASDIKAFLAQNPKAQIRGNSPTNAGKTEAHDRFIIIDQRDVYKIGASIKDLGAAQTSIDKVDGASVAKQYLQQFNTWWQVANEYTNI